MKSVLGIAVRPTTHVRILTIVVSPIDNHFFTVAICPNRRHIYPWPHET